MIAVAVATIVFVFTPALAAQARTQQDRVTRCATEAQKEAQKVAKKLAKDKTVKAVKTAHEKRGNDCS